MIVKQLQKSLGDKLGRIISFGKGHALGWGKRQTQQDQDG
jgi:hypothetical protein